MPTAKIRNAEHDAKHNIGELTWTQAELTEIKKQFANLASVPNYPGAYIVSRYTNFAFLAAYNDGASPSDELLGYIPLINKEFERKREELSQQFFIPTTYDWS